VLLRAVCEDPFEQVVVMVHGAVFASLFGSSNLAAGGGNRQPRFGRSRIIQRKMAA
jgi:hypothetical protein